MQNEKDSNRQQCSGMYSRKAWGGDTDPFVLTKFVKATPPGDEDPIVSLVIFEWRDEEFVGAWPSPDAAEVAFLVSLRANQLLTRYRNSIYATTVM